MPDRNPTTRYVRKPNCSNNSSTVEIPLFQIYRRKIRLIECGAKCRYLTKFTCKWTLRQVFYPSEVPSPPMTPHPCANQREGYRGNSS
jgi:hypothetical protein